MHHDQGGGGREFDREIAIGNGVEGIGSKRLEAELLGNPLPIDRIAGAGERSAAQGQAVDPTPAIAEAFGVAGQHRFVGEQVMAEGHRLGNLQVGQARHDRGSVLLREVDERDPKRAQAHDQCIDGTAQPQPRVGRDLVVARARRVQPLAGITGELRQPHLDVHVHVFERALPDEFAALDLALYLLQATLDGGEIGGGEDAGGREHARMRKRSGNVDGGQAAVGVDRCVKALHALGHRFAEAPRPGALGRCASIWLVAGRVFGHSLPRRRLFPTIAGRRSSVHAACSGGFA